MDAGLTPPPCGSDTFTLPFRPPTPFPQENIQAMFFFFFFLFFFSFGGCFAVVSNKLAVWELPNSGDVLEDTQEGEHKIQTPFTEDSKTPVPYTE